MLELYDLRQHIRSCDNDMVAAGLLVTPAIFAWMIDIKSRMRVMFHGANPKAALFEQWDKLFDQGGLAGF
jgi:hypothetical protein